jgi:hypothetical protein
MKNFSPWEVFLLCPYLVLRVSSLGLALRIFFLKSSHLPWRETPLGSYLVLAEVMLLEAPPSQGEFNIEELPNPLEVPI